MRTCISIIHTIGQSIIKDNQSFCKIWTHSVKPFLRYCMLRVIITSNPRWLPMAAILDFSQCYNLVRILTSPQSIILPNLNKFRQTASEILHVVPNHNIKSKMADDGGHLGFVLINAITWSEHLFYLNQLFYKIWINLNKKQVKLLMRYCILPIIIKSNPRWLPMAAILDFCQCYIS